MRELASSALRTIAFGALALACGKEPLAPPPPIVWHDLATGEALARKEHRPAVVFACADWSVADMMLKRDTFPHPDVRQAMKDFVAIEIDRNDHHHAADPHHIALKRRAVQFNAIAFVPINAAAAIFGTAKRDLGGGVTQIGIAHLAAWYASAESRCPSSVTRKTGRFGITVIAPSRPRPTLRY